MTTEPCKTSSTSILQTADTQSARPIHINVKAAAKRLGVSTSTVYRIDREHGPIRFLSGKRPIAIDLASFETYLANITGTRTEADLQTAEHSQMCRQEETSEQTDSQNPHIKVEEAGVASAIEPVSQVTWCGPREVAVRKHYQAGFICYLA